MSMYNDKIVAAIKVNGQVLRENGDTVSLPFGCEYSILVKNLNSVRAQITIGIDGEDAAGQLIINPNSDLEIERFIKNGNLHVGNKFKFIERSAAVEQHRGIGAEDGLIRVEAWRERVYVPPPMPSMPPPRRYPTTPLRAGPPSGFLRGGSARMSSLGSRRPSQPQAKGSTRPPVPQRPDMVARLKNDVGITVPGGESRQQFVPVYGFPLEYPSTVIVLRLRGEIAGQPISAPITVDKKPECSTCGKINKADSQFCVRCGTALTIFA